MTPRAPFRFVTHHAMQFAAALMVLYFATTTEGRFATADNLLNVLNQNFAYLILGVGMTLVIVSSGIDLSVGSLVAMCGVIGTGVLVGGGVAIDDEGTLFHLIPAVHGLAFGIAAALFFALAAGALVGFTSGWAITRLRVPPFIATLAWFMTARGLAYKFCAARPIGHLPPEFIWLGQGRVGPIRFPVLVAVAVALVVHVLLTRTVFGRHLVAVGGNEEAARLSGVRVHRIKLLVYVVNGVLCGLCGLLLSARLQAGDPKIGAQPPLELGAITAVVLGGASLTGGKGSVGGTVFGALFMGLLDNGLALQGMQYFDQLIVKGFVLLGAVLVDQLRERV